MTLPFTMVAGGVQRKAIYMWLLLPDCLQSLHSHWEKGLSFIIIPTIYLLFFQKQPFPSLSYM